MHACSFSLEHHCKPTSGLMHIQKCEGNLLDLVLLADLFTVLTLVFVAVITFPTPTPFFFVVFIALFVDHHDMKIICDM